MEALWLGMNGTKYEASVEHRSTSTFRKIHDAMASNLLTTTFTPPADRFQIRSVTQSQGVALDPRRSTVLVLACKVTYLTGW
jgi:hypothetical protein